MARRTSRHIPRAPLHNAGLRAPSHGLHLQMTTKILLSRLSEDPAPASPNMRLLFYNPDSARECRDLRYTFSCECARFSCSSSKTIKASVSWHGESMGNTAANADRAPHLSNDMYDVLSTIARPLVRLVARGCGKIALSRFCERKAA